MDFTFTQEHLALRRLIREIAEEEIRPRAKEADAKGEISPYVVKLLREQG